MSLRQIRAEQLADVELRVFREGDSVLREPPCVVVRASSFLLAVAMGDFFRAQLHTPTIDSARLKQERILHVFVRFGPCLGTLDVKTFFDLLNELNHRSLSACALTPDMLARDRLACETLFNTATERLFAMHALAQQFGCDRIRSWVYGRLPRFLNDESARATLDYALTEPDGNNPHGGPRRVRPDAEELYRLVLMWTHCLRPSWTTELDEQLEQLPGLVFAHDEFDTFRPATMLNTTNDSVVMRGSLAKCAECCDNDGSGKFGGPMRTELHAVHAPGTLGYWSVSIEEARNASGARSLVLRRMPVEFCAESMLAVNQRALDDGPIDPREGYALENPCAHTDDTIYNARGLAFDVDVELCLVRTSKAGGATLGEMCVRQRITMDAARAAIRRRPEVPRSALWCFKIAMPPHYGSRQYYTSRCHRCGNDRSIGIVGYRIQITPRRSSAVPLHPDGPDAMELSDVMATA
jgi:hypothetical protein